MAGRVSSSAQRGVERRARILDAALELFAEQGFMLTSLPMIAERVGITHAGILHHFGSKEGVLRALLEREGPVPHFSAWVLNESGADVIAKLPEYAELVIEYPLEMELQFQLFWENRHQADPMHEELLFDNLIREHIASELAAAMSARGVSNEADLGVLAYNVFGFVIGANSQWLVGRDDVMLRAAYRRFTESALQVLFGSAQGAPSQ